MKKHYLTGAAAIALALGVGAAGAQNVDPRRDTQATPPGQSQTPQQQRSDQSQPPQNRQDTRAPQGAQQQNAPASGQAQGDQRSQPGQKQQRDAQAPQGGPPQPGAQDRDKQQDARTEPSDKSGFIAVDEREQARISDILQRQRVQPVTNVNFSLSVANTVPSSVRLARISGDLADIFPHYRDFSFFVTRQELVIVDPDSQAIVAFVPISGGTTIGAAPPKEVAPPKENARTAVTTEPPAPATAPPAAAKKKTGRTEKKRVTVTEDQPQPPDRDADRRRPARTDTDVTVGMSRRDVQVYEEPPPRGPVIVGPPVRERIPGRQESPPFPFSLLFGRWN